MKHPDFGKAAQDYARYRVGFPESLFQRLAGYGVGLAGQSVVDVGTGTGSLGRGLARRGCRVIGVDPSESLLDQARRLDAEAGLTTEYRVGRAEQTGLPDAACDVVSAGQCWHWFDGPRAAAEIARILRPDGRVVVAHVDWIPLEGNLVHATETLIETWNPDWDMGGGNGLHADSLTDLDRAGFRGLETFTYDIRVPFTHETWRGRIRSNGGVGGSLDAGTVEAFDRALAEMLEARFPDPELSVPHRVFALVGRHPDS